jgi:hypothetical protein
MHTRHLATKVVICVSLSKRTTVYFDPAIHQALRIKAAFSNLSVSEIVDEALRLQLAEDQEDLAAFDKSVKEPEMSVKSG